MGCPSEGRRDLSTPKSRVLRELNVAVTQREGGLAATHGCGRAEEPTTSQILGQRRSCWATRVRTRSDALLKDCEAPTVARINGCPSTRIGEQQTSTPVSS